MVSGAFFLYSLPYFEKMPQLECQATPGGAYTDCTQEEACSLGTGLDFRVNYDSIDSLHNWVE
jgi:MFS family permease